MTLRLVPKRDNVVDLHEYRRRQVEIPQSPSQRREADFWRSVAHEVRSDPLAGRWRQEETAGLADDPRRPALRSSKSEGGDAWPLPCDVEPDPAA